MDYFDIWQNVLKDVSRIFSRGGGTLFQKMFIKFSKNIQKIVNKYSKNFQKYTQNFEKISKKISKNFRKFSTVFLRKMRTMHYFSIFLKN